ncbi:MAG: DUF1353 domain-containing protein [bacterium]
MFPGIEGGGPDSIAIVFHYHVPLLSGEKIQEHDLMAFYEPEFSNPYPEGYNGETITEFNYKTPLIIRREAKAIQVAGRGEPDYLVAEPYRVSFQLAGQPRAITVPKGMLTDLTSVPRIARSIVGKVGRHLEAAIVHDFLYIAWQLVDDRKALREDRLFADDLMYEAMKVAGVGWFKRSLIYRAVRDFGRSTYEDRNPDSYYVIEDGG